MKWEVVAMKIAALSTAIALAGLSSAWAQPAAPAHDPAQVAAAAAMHKTCAADQDKFCASAASPHEQLACMRKIMDQLSPACAKAINDLPPGKAQTPKP
jgi:hypothetical protein